MVPGRRTVTFRPPSGSGIVRHGRPSVPSERARGARLGGKSVTDNRQGATVTTRMTHIATDTCSHESERVMRMLTSLDGRPLPAITYVNRLTFDLVSTRGTDPF